MIRKKKSFVALLLAVALIFSSLSVSAVEPETDQQTDYVQGEIAEEMTSSSQTFTSDDVIGEVEEIIELREENVKHFRLADGTYEAVIYAEPVHRQDENGEWQDIDNTLTLSAEKSVQRYATPDLRVSFADRFAANKDLLVINENGYSISMKFINDQATGQIATYGIPDPIVNNAEKRQNDRAFDDIADAAKIDNRSSILYNNIDTYTNLEYILQGNDIKENIIVTAQRECYEYVFQLNITGLVAELDATGNIELIDAVTGQAKYSIPAPYMSDSAGAYSDEVYYELQSSGDGEYTIKVIANKEWMNAEDRAFPVTIDPSITEKRVVKDSFTYSTYPNAQYGSSTELWISDTCTTYISIDLPTLPSGATFNSAYLHVYYYYNAGVTDGSLLAGAYQVLSSWNESTITYNNAPTVSSTRLSTATMYATGSYLEASPGHTSFNISNAARDWYSGEDANYGIALKRESSTASTKTSVILKSYQAGENYAYISVNYTYYVPDGVYALKGNGFYYRWLTIEDDSPWEGKKIQQTYSAESPASTFDRSCLFKISRKSGNCYIIRSMLNNNLSFGISDGEIITKTIPSDDADVSYADTFYIEWASPGFLLRPYGSSEVIRISSASIEDLTTVAKEDATLTAQWTLVQYTGTHKASVTIYFPTDMNAGVTATLTPIVWSTQINYNTPRMESVSETDSYATLTWNDKDQCATAVLHQKGAFKLIQHIDNANQSSCCSWTFTFNIGLVVDEGIYFIKNKEVGKYMQIDDNDDPDYNTSGSHMELWDYDGGGYQRWELIHIGDGYYEIVSEKSGMALCVPSGFTDENEVALIQETYSNLSRKKWKITKSSSGAYILRPKSGESYDTDWCMCAGGQFLWVTDGLNVEQRSYEYNDSYKDEWELELVDDYIITFYGISNSGHDHSSCLKTVRGNLHDAGFNNITLKTGAISSSDCLSDLKNSNVFTSRSHGYLVVWKGTDTASSTGIMLNDGEPETVALFSHSWSGMTSGSTSITAADSFAGVNMVLFIGCQTAYDGTTGRNLPAVVSSQGAEVAIGFSESINCSDANKWTKDFYSYLLEGHTVQESVDYASGNRSDTSGLKSAVVFGNGDYRIAK